MSETGLTPVAATTSESEHASTPASATAKLPPIPSLDGFRALAVVIVVVAHAGMGGIVPGGLGVTVFFFLSGYLITTLLLDEWGKRSAVHVPHFYARRAYRLLPPLFITLAIAYSLVALGLLGGGTSWEGLASQVFYFANYFDIFLNEGGGRPDGTGILWSLAVEEHFYILFPLVMVGLLKVGSRRLIAGVFVAGCVAALAWRTWLVSRPGFTELRTYYASDTRFDSILYGALLAVVYNPARRPVEPGRTAMRPVDWVLFTAAVGMLLATIVYRGAEFRETLRYTLQGLALLPIFYYAIRYPTERVFSVLNHRWLVRIGVLSYGIYLIHDIVLHVMTQNLPFSLPPPVRFVVGFSLAVCFAVAVDRFVDPYFRRRRAALR